MARTDRDRWDDAVTHLRARLARAHRVYDTSGSQVPQIRHDLARAQLERAVARYAGQLDQASREAVAAMVLTWTTEGNPLA